MLRGAAGLQRVAGDVLEPSRLSAQPTLHELLELLHRTILEQRRLDHRPAPPLEPF